MQTYIINLESAKERREHMLRELAPLVREGEEMLTCEFIKGIDGRTMPEDQIATLIDRKHDDSHFLNFDGGKVSRGEIGCALSHIACYRALIESGADYALILEDDTLLSKDLASLLPDIRRFFEKQAAKPSILLLSAGFVYHKFSRRRFSGKYKLCKVTGGCSAYAYVVNRRAAELLVGKLLPLHIVADNWRAIGSYGVTIHSLIPHPVSWLARTEMDSQISPISDWKPVSETTESWRTRLRQMYFSVRRGCYTLAGFGKCGKMWDSSTRDN